MCFPCCHHGILWSTHVGEHLKLRFSFVDWRLVFSEKKKKVFMYIYISIKSSLQLSVKSNSWLHWFCFLLITFLCDWSRTYTPSQPIRCKTKTSHDVITSYLVVSMMCLILLWAVTAYRLLVPFSFVQYFICWDPITLHGWNANSGSSCFNQQNTTSLQLISRCRY